MKNLLKSIWWIVFVLLIQILIIMLFAISTISKGVTNEQELNNILNNNILIISIISNLVFAFIFILFLKIKKKNIKEELKINKINIKEYFMPCAIAFFYSVFYFFITYKSNINQTSPMYISANYYGMLGIPILFIALILIGPVIEEMLFRGIIMNTIKKSFNIKTTILISSLLFAIMHITSGGISLVIGAFFMGIILTTIYQTTNSLYVPIVAHMIANLPDVIIYMAPTISNTIKYILAGISLIMAMICIVIWYKQIELKNKNV